MDLFILLLASQTSTNLSEALKKFAYQLRNSNQWLAIPEAGPFL